jgi:hypothetical protein
MTSRIYTAKFYSIVNLCIIWGAHIMGSSHLFIPSSSYPPGINPLNKKTPESLQRVTAANTGSDPLSDDKDWFLAVKFYHYPGTQKYPPRFIRKIIELLKREPNEWGKNFFEGK